MRSEYKKLLEELGEFVGELNDEPTRQEILRKTISTIECLVSEAEQSDIDAIRALHERNELRKIVLTMEVSKVE